MLEIIPMKLMLFWAFFVFLCVMPMVLALITDKKDKETKKKLNIQ